MEKENKEFVKEEIMLLRGIFNALLALTEKLTNEKMIVPFRDEKQNRTTLIKGQEVIWEKAPNKEAVTI